MPCWRLSRKFCTLRCFGLDYFDWSAQHEANVNETFWTLLQSACMCSCSGITVRVLENVISDTTIRDTKTKCVTNNLSVTRVHETRHRLVVAHALGARRVTNNDVFVTRVNKTRHG